MKSPKTHALHPEVEAHLVKTSPFLQKLKPSERERWIGMATRIDGVLNRLRFRHSEPLGRNPSAEKEASSPLPKPVSQ
jgi:hypothetical protein